ncbi:MAG: 3-hydroxyacyl-CoA dehydrogenase NAD-binding domain-containing protein [Pseudomonadota bacterium]|jgi:3-hydroxyacyl-CoA dehydrogenase
MVKTNEYGDVVEIVLSNPPVNALGSAVRKSLLEAVEQAEARQAVKAIVIRGNGKLFSGGADITEFGKPLVDPGLSELINRVEACQKPVVALIHGMALGGGLELALGCHYRLAAAGAKLGLPEVKLGLLPGAGGTQRLPRLIHGETALGMITSGNPISAEQAVEIGLVDEIVTGPDHTGAAVAFARSLDRVRRTADLPTRTTEADIDIFIASNARTFGQLEAPATCAEAVRASMLPLEQGLTEERELFIQLMKSDQSKALRHIFFAERAAGKIKGLPEDVKKRTIARVGVIGAGTMGGGISMNFLSNGIPVTIAETNQEALDRGVNAVRKNYEASAAKGRMSESQVETAMGMLTPTLDFDALGDCDLVIEAVYEDMDLKKQIFARLDTIAKPGAILATNTSLLDVDEIAAATSRPGDVVGMHFFSPANIMKLLEVVRGAKTADDTLATAMDMGRKIGKIAVVAGVCYGFIGNRILLPRREQSLKLLLEGATPAQIDKIHTDFGLPMGPFHITDLAGVDLGWHRDPSRVDNIVDALCAEGRWGQKTGAGFYDYDEKRRPSPSSATQGIIEKFRAEAGITPREISDEEIVVRTLYTMVNEAILILQKGIAQRASDIDVVWVYGYGWPSWRGGPVYWGDQVGFANIDAGLRKYSRELGPEFKIAENLASYEFK